MWLFVNFLIKILGEKLDVIIGLVWSNFYSSRKHTKVNKSSALSFTSQGMIESFVYCFSDNHASSAPGRKLLEKVLCVCVGGKVPVCVWVCDCVCLWWGVRGCPVKFSVQFCCNILSKINTNKNGNFINVFMFLLQIE